jgi:hypothetical protein
MTLMAGPGGVFRPDDEINVSPEVGKALIAARSAVAIDDMNPIRNAEYRETASAEPRENVVKAQRGRPRKIK